MDAISFALFGYAGNVSNSYPFPSYFRGLSFNIKMAELLYPGWKCHVTLDRPTYDHFRAYFDYHVEGGRIDIEVNEPDDLCKMMLHRMRPVFSGVYDRVLCRDLDSLTSFRERQAVEYWISTGRVVHCMTDSVSHNISLMGGMIGFACKEFKEIMGVETFEELINQSYIDYRIKGADQKLLNAVVLPKIAHTMVEHYLLGLPQSFRGECYNYVQDIDIEGVSRDLTGSNLLIEHIGADGFKQDSALLFFDAHFTQEQKDYYAEIEDKFKEVFYWRMKI